jgi:hypothetical protein
VFPPSSERHLYQNRKGFVSQNCLFSCDFDLTFTFALTGWEGSVTDAHLWDEALEGGLKLAPGKYFLADAGFPSRPDLLVPYHGVCYHLAEWGRASIR